MAGMLTLSVRPSARRAAPSSVMNATQATEVLGQVVGSSAKANCS